MATGMLLGLTGAPFMAEPSPGMRIVPSVGGHNGRNTGKRIVERSRYAAVDFVFSGFTKR